MIYFNYYPKNHHTQDDVQLFFFHLGYNKKVYTFAKLELTKPINDAHNCIRIHRLTKEN